MDCEQALILISAALDGELTEFERAALEEHLKECPECRALSEDFGVVSVALSAMNAEPPADLIGRVNAVLDAEQAPAAVPKKTAGWKRWGSFAAMFAVVACLGGVYLFSGLGGGSTANDAAAPQSAYGMDTPRPSSVPEAAMDSVETAEGSAPAGGYGETDAGTEAKSDDFVFDGYTVINGVNEPLTTQEQGVQAAPAMEAALTAAEAAEQVFDWVGGTDAYPDAVWNEDEASYILEETETGEESFKTALRYTGLSANGCYYTFQTYRETVDDFVAAFTYVNNYAVKLDGSELLVERDETGEDNAGAYRAAIGE